jgi:hypothetical protein
MAANSLTESPRLPGCGIQSHALVPTMSRGVPRRSNGNTGAITEPGSLLTPHKLR